MAEQSVSNAAQKGGEPLYCAVDIGGTKSDAVLFDGSGRIVSRRLSRGITPVDAHFDECVAHYIKTLTDILSDAGGRRVASSYLSVATVEHYSPAVQDSLKAVQGAGVLRAEPDGICLISSSLGHREGCSMICGTGSSLYVRNSEGFYRIGGWGHFIDSCGSGFVLGRLALRAALRAHDGRDGPTALTELLGEKIGRPVWEDYDRIYALGRPYVASLAGCLFEAAKQGDAAALKIFDDCSSDLAELVQTARRREGKPLTVVLNGGVFANHPEYADAVKAKSPVDTTFVDPVTPPVYGCAVEALYSVGIEPDTGFEAAFLRDYRSV